jgi:hypothetical protein
MSKGDALIVADLEPRITEIADLPEASPLSSSIFG